MMRLSRTDTSIVATWWWTIDRWTLAAISIIVFFGILLILAATPAVANRIGLDSFYLIRHHFILLAPSLAVMVGVSLLNPRQIRRLAVYVFIAALALTALTLVAGDEIKGARRWIGFGGFSLQPSEFLKPSFAVVVAWMFAARHARTPIPGNLIAMALYGLVVLLLLAQPDLGMTFVISAAWFGQFFLAGLPILWVAGLAVIGVVALVGAYFTFPHVTERVNSFLDPASGDSYQIDRSLEAFTNGGLYGRGPGEGTIKEVLPDAHSDFIFAVAGEEFGLILCLIIVALYAFVILRGLGRIMNQHNLFLLLAAAGLLASFGLQAIINMASTLHLMPTKGMTLPFISYGGSSMLALGYGMGMFLALTRKHAALTERW